MILKEVIEQLQKIASQGHENLPVLIEDWVSYDEEPELFGLAIVADADWIDDIPDFTSTPKCILLKARNFKDI